MCRAPAAWAWWHAVGAPLERRVRAHWWRTAVDCEFHAFDSGGTEALRQEQSRYSASAEIAVALQGASRLASSSSRPGRGEDVCQLVGVSATVTTTKQSPPKAASWCIWIGRLQAGPDRNPTFRGQRRPALRAGAAHRRAHAALADTMPSAVCAVDAAFAELADTALWCALTFELRGPQRQDALARTEKMYRLPQAGPRWPAVAGPLERVVRPRCC